MGYSGLTAATPAVMNSCPTASRSRSRAAAAEAREWAVAAPFLRIVQGHFGSLLGDRDGGDKGQRLQATTRLWISATLPWARLDHLRHLRQTRALQVVGHHFGRQRLQAGD